MSNNETCFMQVPSPEPPLIQNGVIVFQAHHIGWIVTGAFALVSTCTSFWLVNKHLQWYTKELEQSYIVRILFMVPIYSIVSFASYLFWNHSTPLLLLRDCYESIVLTAFFYLLLNYLSPKAEEQGAIFSRVGLSKENDHWAIMRGEPVKKWLFPLKFIKSKPAPIVLQDGLYFLQMMKWGVLQYCVIRPVTTLAAVILNYIGLYCEDSWSPGWGHVYITVLVSISVSIAMYCLFQLYLPISECLAPHRPLLKLFSIKAVVFLTFWQATFLSILSFAGVVKDTQYMTADDINIGIGAILETVEMTIFALLHIKAFSYKPYCTPFADPDVLSQRRPRLRALLHAFDFRETLRELWTGWLYIIRRWRGAETDGRARRLLVRKDLFDVSLVLGSRSQRGSSGMGKQLLSYAPVREGPDQFARVDEKYDGCDLAIAIEVEKEFHIKDERQRIGTGDDYIYGLGLSRHERSAGPAEQIEDELDRRCLPARVSYGISQARENIKEQPTDIDALMNDGVEEPECHGRKRRSWWGGMYDRLSHSGGYNAQDVFDPALKSRMQKSNKDRQCNAFTAGDSIEREYYYSAVEENLYDEPPPPSSIWEHWKSESTLSNAVTCFRPDSVVFTPCTPDESSPTTVQDFGPHPSTKLSPEDDATFARLFPDPPTSVSLNARNSTTEASGPSSQTHPSSDGNHVRLITPALVMPTLEWRATVRMPVVVGHSAAESRSTSTKASFDEERGLPHEIQNERSQPYGRLGVFDEAPSAIHLNRNSGESLARRHRRKYARHESLTANPPYMERKYVIRPLPFAPAPRRNFRSPTVHHAYVPKPDVAAERPQDSFTSYPSIQSIHTIQEDDAHKHGPRLKRREAKHTLRQAHSDAYIPTFISARQLTRVATASMPLRNHGAQPSMIYPHSADRSRARVHVRPRPRLNFPRHGVQEQAV